jgi:UDP-glucose 4-epimerase
MTVLVTGGAGYIGSHMVWALLDAGEQVIVVDRLSTGFEWAVAPEAKLIHADVSDTATIAEIIRAHGIEAIIHFAGSISVPESIADPLGYYQNNTANSLALIRTAVATGVKQFVFSSTAAVYGTPQSDEAIAENTPTVPQSPYGASKLMTETMLADAAAAHEFRYAALRYFNVSGADPLGRTGQSTRGAANLIKVATEAAMGKRDGIEVFGSDYPTRDGTCVRDFIHVADLVAAHLDALTYLRAGRRQPRRQLRLWTRLHGARGARFGPAAQRPRFRDPSRPPSPGRHRHFGCRFNPGPHCPGLDPAPRQPRRDRRQCTRLGSGACAQQPPN